ncbi:hypothetical protein PMAC_001538 [Pneumocystis sp. 'macacae']|nr:hypothetical protein PMAC_001538 [Pneumocystis sp. 'macacae']
MRFIATFLVGLFGLSVFALNIDSLYKYENSYKLPNDDSKHARLVNERWISWLGRPID